MRTKAVLRQRQDPWAHALTRGHVDQFFAVENVLNETYATARTSEGVGSVGAPRMFHGGVRLSF